MLKIHIRLLEGKPANDPANEPAKSGRPTEGHDDGAGDTVGHDHGENVHQPGIGRPELELIGLMLETEIVFITS